MPGHSSEQQKANGWMTLTQASKYLKISPPTLRHAAEEGVLPVQHPLSNGPWIFFSKATSTAMQPGNSSIAPADEPKSGALRDRQTSETLDFQQHSFMR
jgi:hypothetical protein